MRHLIYCVILFVVCSLVSCKENKEQLPLFDFGSETFDEPFVGLLSSRPEILVKSLDYPPFSWLMSDTVSFSKELEIEFNEDCIRSKSSVRLYVTDTLFSTINGVRIYFNNRRVSNCFSISADSLLKSGSLRIVIRPELKDTILTGYILAEGSDVDVVNNIDLQNTNNIVATWKSRQKIGWPILIWLLWITLPIALLTVFVLVVNWLFQTIFIVKEIADLSNFIDTKKIRYKIRHRNKVNKKKKKNKKKEMTLKEYLHKYNPKAEIMVEEIISRLNRTWDDFSKEEISKGHYYLHFNGNSNCTIEFDGKVVRAKAGWQRRNKIVGLDYGYNEFLNYRMQNTIYIIDEYMRFETDSKGRLTKATAEFDRERIIERIRPNTISNEQRRIVESQQGKFYDSNGQKKDDGGHMIQMALGGCNELLNQVPMDKDVNRSDVWKQIENTELDECWNRGNHVTAVRELKYKGNSLRPYCFIAKSKVMKKGGSIIVNGPFEILNP